MLNIAIDGPSGAGKSTVAKQIAQKLNIMYLDTGAMYRAVAYTALQKGLSVTQDVQQIITLMDNLRMEISYDEQGTQRVIVNGLDVSGYIRQNAISQAASDISKIPEVRLKLVELQREIAANNDVVLDGRDITSYVLPNSKHKFYVTASAEERAKRRYKELIERGQQVDYEELLQAIIFRDNNDMNRSFAPLVRTEDAHYIDTTNLSIDRVVEEILSYVR